MMSGEIFPEHQFIPMEKFDLQQTYEVKLLQYYHPSRFSLYLRQKVDALTEFQTELQHAMNNYRSTPLNSRYQVEQPVAFQDLHKIWHRGTILQLIDQEQVHVYFVDAGLEETIPLNKIRPLPHEFFRQPAFAIPCRLYQIYPRNSLLQSSWTPTDPVHQEFQKLKDYIFKCQIRRIEEKCYYEVQLDIPGIGDFSTYLLRKNLISQVQTQSHAVQRFPSPTPSTQSFQQKAPTAMRTVRPEDGQYTITQIHSALEFYGYSQRREREFEVLQEKLRTLFSSNHDQSLSVIFPSDGTICAIQYGEKFHRVVIKNRDSDSRVFVRLIDHGDEILVDPSELVRLDDQLCSIAVFAQPFRLHGFNETQSTPSITRKLKKVLLHQKVHITLHEPAISGFYPVDVRFSDGINLHDILLSDDLPVRGFAPIEEPVQRFPSENSVEEPVQPSLTVQRSSSTVRGRGFGVRPMPTETVFSPPRTQNFRPYRQKPVRPPPTNVSHVEPRIPLAGPSPSSNSNASKPEVEPFEAAARYPEQKLPSGKFTFVVSHLEQINDFFIQDLSSEKDLLALGNDLQEHCHAALDFPLHLMKVNLPCLAKNNENCWYRAEILSIDSNTVQIRFVDFGDTLEVKFESVRLLSKKFAVTAPYAYRCALKDVQSLDHRTVDEKLIGSLAGRTFQGELKKKSLLESEDLKAHLLHLDLVQIRISCILVYLDFDRYEFFVHTDEDLMREIHQLVKKEEKECSASLSAKEIQRDSMMIATFEDEPYRAMIEADYGDEVEVYFVDYGNRSRTLKSDLRKCSEKLKNYPPQGKRCRLAGVSSTELDSAFSQMEDFLESVPIEISPVEDDQVLVYHQGQCLNDSLNSTKSTVKEREVCPSKGILRHFQADGNRIFLQTRPDNDRLVEQIENLVRSNMRSRTYRPGDQVIVQRNEDEHYSRGRIEKYSLSTREYSVYFLDYGHCDEHVKINQLYASSNEVDSHPALVEEFFLDNIDFTVRQWLKENLDRTVHFQWVDREKRLIRIDIDRKDEIRTETYTGTIAGVDQDRFYLHLRPNCDALICEMEELIESHPKERTDRPWSRGDRCLVEDLNEEKVRRGMIVDLDEKRGLYKVQCIDYGYVLPPIKGEHLYRLKNEGIFGQKPLAQLCRLYGVSHSDRIQANDELLQHIPPTEPVTITVQETNNDGEMSVMLFRANHDIVNDLYRSKKFRDSLLPNDVRLCSMIGNPQAESTHQYGDTTNITWNQPSLSMTIDFGENDSSRTTMKDEQDDLP